MTTVILAFAALSLALSAGALIWSAVSDVRAYEIPDAASIIIAGGFVCFSFCAPSGSVVYDLVIGAGVFIGGALLFARGLMGGGDVKLAAATSLWCGPHLLASFGVVVGLSGAVLAALMLSPLRRLMPPAPNDAVSSSGSSQGLRQPMPFGVAIAVGGLWVLAQRAGALV